MPEARQVALYFLVGESTEGDEPKAYIGQTGDVVARLGSHQRSKDFWDRALVLISKTNSLTQTHALFLEWHCLRACQQAGRYVLDNGNAGTKPHTPAPLEADCLEIFETGSTLLATLGHPLFDPVAGGKATNDDEVFHCTAIGAKGRGVYTTEGFVILEGSVGRLENVKSIQGTAGAALRQRLLDAQVMVPDGDRVIFKKDHLFRSPSMAALALLGRSCNGWVDWKTKDGRTLDEVKRRDLAS
jgi:hypothetical protein